MLNVIGFGSGTWWNMTTEVMMTLSNTDLIVGYKTYTDLLKKIFSDIEYYENGMRGETERCLYALEEAKKKDVCIVSSGDAGVYGMAGLVYELAAKMKDPPEIYVISGVTAACSGAALLGAPLSHDFSVISLSDLMTDKKLIKKRLAAAAKTDMVICIYNPESKKRAGYLAWACRIVAKYKSWDTVCGAVKNIGRDEEKYQVMTLKELASYDADMFTTVYIGNKNTKEINGSMVTPRGYRL